MKEKLVQIHNTISLIPVKGQDTINMALSMQAVAQLAQADENFPVEQTKENLIQVHNTLSLIPVKGQDAVNMALSLQAVAQLVQLCDVQIAEQAEEKAEKQEKKPVAKKQPAKK